MENYNKLWRIFFAVSLIAIAVQQIVCSGFRPVIIPPSPDWLSANMVCVWIGSILLTLASAAIILSSSARSAALYLGAALVLLLVVFHIPYNLKTNLHALGGWNDAFKILAYSGGAFVVAGSVPQNGTSSNATKTLEKLIPAGRFFFAIMITVFGVEHFMYAPFVAGIIPAYLPGHLFLTYFAGAALIGSGLAILLNIQLRLAATLLGIMIFLWFVMLHIPRAIQDPHSGNGNEWTSVFEALGFSGIAFLIAANSRFKKPAN